LVGSGEFIGAGLVAAQILESVCIPDISADLWRSDTGLSARANFNSLECVGKGDEAPGVGKRQWPQQYALDDGEGCGGGADAQGQHQHGADGESQRLAQLPQCVPQLFKDGLHNNLQETSNLHIRHGILNLISDRFTASIILFLWVWFLRYFPAVSTRSNK
jgi:hypothetical protein